MYAIHRFGSEEQKQRWLPRMAAGEVIGCFGLTEPDHGSDPAGDADVRQAATAADWVLNGRKMWITNGSVAGVAVVWAQTDDGHPRLRRPHRHPRLLRPRDQAQVVAARLGHQRTGPGRGTAARRRGAARGHRAARPAQLSQPRPLRHRLGRHGRGARLLRGGARLREDPGAVRPADRRLPAHPGQARRHGASNCTRASCSPTIWGGGWTPGGCGPEQVSFGKLNNVREAIEICRTARTILGANGISLEYPVMRHATNLESVLTYEGTVEMHQLVLGKALTGLDAFR